MNRPIRLAFAALAVLIAVSTPAQLIRDNSAAGLTPFLIQHTSGYINVKEPPYNAVGNGIADDTAAVQAANVAARGGVLFFPPGTYKLGFGANPAAYSILLPLRSNTQVIFAKGAQIVASAASGDGSSTGANCALFGADTSALPVSHVEIVDLNVTTTIPAAAGTYTLNAIQLSTPPDSAADSITDISIVRPRTDAMNVYILQRSTSAGPWANARQVRGVKIVDHYATNVTGSAVTADGAEIEIVNPHYEGTAAVSGTATVSGSNASTTNILVDSSTGFGVNQGVYYSGDSLTAARRIVTAVPDSTHITVSPAFGAAPTSGTFSALMVYDAVSMHSGLHNKVIGGMMSGFNGGGIPINIRNNINSLCGSRDILVDGVQFHDNWSANNAHVYVSSSGSGGTGENTYGVSNIKVRGCKATDGVPFMTMVYGNVSPAPPAFTDITVEDNQGTNLAGGIFLQGTASLLIVGLHVSGNRIAIPAGYVGAQGFGLKLQYAANVAASDNIIRSMDSGSTTYPFFIDTITYGAFSTNDLSSENTTGNFAFMATNLTETTWSGNHIRGKFDFTHTTATNHIHGLSAQAAGSVMTRNVSNGEFDWIGSRITLYTTARPASGTWGVGDRWIQTTPVVGNPKSEVVTVAGTYGGTPPTWVSEGNL